MNTQNTTANLPGMALYQCPPGPWRAEGNSVKCIDHGRWYTVVRVDSKLYSEEGKAKIARYIAESGNAADSTCGPAPIVADLLAALKALLEQVTGPAMVYGDGIGNDGKKTGLTHWEFNKLRDERIEAARAAIAKVEGY